MENRKNLPAAPALTEAERQHQLDLAAIETAKKMGPRVYRITGINTNPVRFFVLGCHGNGKTAQKNTAQLMNEVAEELQRTGDTKPAFILYLGDNVYDYGVNNPSDNGFHKCFHEIYYDEKLKGINHTPGWLLLGNHDVNRHRKSFMSNNVPGFDTGIHQAAHTYIDSTEKKIEQKAAPYQQPEIPVSKLSHWNMPYTYYSIIAGNTQIFCLDSNSYLQEYLELKNGKVKDGINIETGRVNQAAWLEREYAAAKKEGRQIFFAQHHPLNVCGKRAFLDNYDYNHYLPNWQDVVDLNGIIKKQDPDYNETSSYNSMLASVYKVQGFHPDLVFVAHEHFISYYNNALDAPEEDVLVQATLGGGGGDLQNRQSYRGHPYVSVHQEHNGFGMVTCDPRYPKEFTLDVYTTEGLHLQFNEDSQHPVMRENTDDPQVEMLRHCVLDACDRYFSYLKEVEEQAIPKDEGLKQKPIEKSTGYGSFFAPITSAFSYVYSAVATTSSLLIGFLFHNSTHDKENRIVQDIQAYFSQVDLPDLQTALKHLYDQSQQLPYRAQLEDKVFTVILKRVIQEKFGMSLNTLFHAAGLCSPEVESQTEQTANAMKM